MEVCQNLEISMIIITYRYHFVNTQIKKRGPHLLCQEPPIKGSITFLGVSTPPIPIMGVFLA